MVDVWPVVYEWLGLKIHLLTDLTISEAWVMAVVVMLECVAYNDMGVGLVPLMKRERIGCLSVGYNASFRILHLMDR